MTVESKTVPMLDAHERDVKAVNWPTYSQAKQVPDSRVAVAAQTQMDHFIVRNGVEFAGTHIIIDLWGAHNLDNIEVIESAMRDGIKAAGATLLHIHLHHFTPNAGVSGVAVLAESHISVHTWPERGFAAFDVFMCGDAEPEKVIPVLQSALRPDSVSVSEHLRGASVLQAVCNEATSMASAPLMTEANDETL